MGLLDPMTELTLGYHKIRGLGAPCRMIVFYASAPCKMVNYGSDMKEEWFAGDKPKLAEKNAMINLPYVLDGDLVVTQSNSCLLYLGKKLGIDEESLSIQNHQVLDQTMDLRNDQDEGGVHERRGEGSHRQLCQEQLHQARRV